MFKFAWGMALTVAFPALAVAQETVDPTTYPELTSERLLPPVMAELRKTLKDPGSIKDMIFCPAAGLKFKDGQLIRWRVAFSFNARNSYGGYEGEAMYMAVFKAGKSIMVSRTQMDGTDGLDGLINKEIAKGLAGCPYLSDDMVQSALQSNRTR